MLALFRMRKTQLKSIQKFLEILQILEKTKN